MMRLATSKNLADQEHLKALTAEYYANQYHHQMDLQMQHQMYEQQMKMLHPEALPPILEE